jgi:sulfur-oxidizing protein SoxZ
MAEPMRIRAQLKGDVTEIKMIVNHAMETGMRKDSAGATVPAHFIQRLSVDIAGKRVIESEIGTSVSRNPVMSFKAKGFKVGDKVVVNWVDSKGDKRTDEVAIS